MIPKIELDGLPVIEVSDSEEITIAVKPEDLQEGDEADPKQHPIAIAHRRERGVEDARVSKREVLIRRGDQWFRYGALSGFHSTFECQEHRRDKSSGDSVPRSHSEQTNQTPESRFLIGGKSGSFPMKKSLLVAFLITIAGNSLADTLTPYSDPGNPNTAFYTFTALATGNVTGFFAGASAADLSVVGLSVNGGTPTVFGLNNQSTAISQSLNFGSVSAGDSLIFILRNQTTGTQFSSDPVSNPDGQQHVFSAGFTNSGGAIPSGIQISFEDLAKSQGSDFDYNDASFIFTNVTDDPVGAAAPMANPLPGALVLFTGGLGVIGVAFLLRPRRRKRRYSHP